MKKLMLVIGLLVVIKLGFGQLPDGSIAPNFTLQDIHGDWHTLYDYLDSGKTVLINIASTYPDAQAGQSFLYFTEGGLNSFYSLYGPDGTNECMVLMLETDPNTNVNGLYGIGSTLGDWEGYANFPIISNDSIGEFYPVGPAYPSSYMICPNRRTTHVGWTTAAGLYYFVGLCGEPEFTNNASINNIANPGIGNCQQELEPVITVENRGFEVLQKLEIQYSIDGSILGSYNWEGNISMYTTEEITLPVINLESEGEHSLEITILNPNDSTDQDTTDNYIQKTFVANFDGSPVALDILTDNNPNELIWRIRQGSDILYSVNGYENVGQIYEDICLDPEECYTLDVFDTNNNGMTEGGEGHVILSWNNNTLVNLQGSDYGADFSMEFCLQYTNIVENENSNRMKIYPNPATDKISVHFNIDKANIRIMDVSGKVVINRREITKNSEINVSELPEGIYFVVVKNSNLFMTDKLIIE